MHKPSTVIVSLVACIAVGSCKDVSGPTTGAVRVAVTTTGLDLDADGYVLTVDAAPPRTLGAADVVVIRDLATGSHTMALGGVANNCAVGGDAARAVIVTAGDTTHIAFAVGCAPVSGSVQLTIASEGVDLDPDGFAVAFDGGIEQPLPVNGAVLISPVLVGEHTVELRGVAANCTVSGPPVRSVTVPAGAPGDTERATVDVAYTVACAALVGDLRVATVTTGMDLDSDGYTVSVDGGPAQAVDVNGAFVIAQLRSGEHLVELDGLAGNCTVAESNPRSVDVTFSAIAGVTFTVTCRTLKGSLRVRVTTSGVDAPDRYTVILDSIAEVGIPERPSVPANGAIVISGLSPGGHLLSLYAMPANCAVSGAIPQPVVVAAGDTAEVALAVTCTALPPPIGALRVITATSGVYSDHDKYVVSVDGLGGGDVAVNGVLIVGGLSVGDHAVELRVPSNCDVGGANPRPVSIVAGDTAEVAFVVNCRTTLGVIEVAASTSGAAPDPSGYAIGVDRSCDAYGNDCSYNWSEVVSVNGTVRFVVNAGHHTVWLDDVAANCAASGGTADTVQVVAGDTSKVTFEITCTDLIGELRVTAVTTGMDHDANGYTVRVDDRAWHIVPVNGAVVVPGPWAVGDHEVELNDVAPNCSISGANPRTVTVSDGDTAGVEFAITCNAVSRTGSVRVITTTTGVDLDPDGYNVSLEGGSEHAVGVNDTLALTDVPAGDHVVALGGVAPNCAVAGADPQTVTVTSGDTTTVAFAVGCSALIGSLRVTTATTGTDLDDDGYSASVDGGPSQAVGVNDTITISVPPGDHTVYLGGVAANCAVDGANPRPARVAPGATPEVTFAVACRADVGTVRVTAVTTGADLDPNGYLVELRGGGHSLPVNGLFTYDSVPPGKYPIELRDVASNCAVSGPNPQTVTVVSFDTAEVTFAVTCAASGSIQVTVTTTGADLDPDGYGVVLRGLCRWMFDGDGGFGYECDYEHTVSIGVNDTVTIPNVPAGTGVELQGVARNCAVAGEGSRPATADVAFAVTCLETGSLRVAVTTTGFDLDPDFWVQVQGAGGDIVEGVPPNGAVTVQLLPGDHSVTVTGVAGNCAVGGQNPVIVTVVAGATVDVAFAVTCVALGSMQVTVATTGVALDPDGYRVRVSGFAWYVTYAVPVNGAVTISGVVPGDHTVALEGEAANCVVEGTNPRSVSVGPGGTTDVAFAITCAAVGSVRVTVATTGSELDADGYSVSVDEASGQAVSVNGAVTISGLPAGDHTVTLGGVAANCAVDGANPRLVSVTTGATAAVTIAVICVATGSVRVSTTTTGTELDVDGYTAILDPWSPPMMEDGASGGGAATSSGSARSSPIGLNDAVLFSGVEAGSHRLVLGGVAANCTVDGPIPRVVSLPRGGTAAVDFVVTCVATGSLRVTTTTTGVEPDADGYGVSVDGGPPQAVAVNSAITFSGLPVGDHRVTLGGVAANCSVDGSNSVVASVTTGATTDVAFGISCIAATDIIEVTVATTGAEPQSNDYGVRIDRVCDYDDYGGEYCYYRWEGVVAANGSVRFSGVPVGDHTVWLDVARNCAVVGENPRTVIVPPGDTGRVAFAVTCEPTGSMRVTVATTGFDLDPDGYDVRVQGGVDDVSQGVAVSGTVTISQLLPGEHTVTLGGVAGNCTAGGQNPVTLTVVGGATVDVAFAVACAAKTALAP